MNTNQIAQTEYANPRTMANEDTGLVFTTGGRHSHRLTCEADKKNYKAFRARRKNRRHNQFDID